MKTFNTEQTEMIADMASFCEEHYEAFKKTCNEDVTEFDDEVFDTIIKKAYE